jgi:hypothetical protein
VQRWLWVTLPDFYTSQPFSVGESFTWRCHPDTRERDVSLLYRADLLKDVFRVESDPFDDPDIAREFIGSPACDCTLVAALQWPITLDLVRADPVLSRCPAALVGFHSSAFPIEPPEWRALLRLAIPLDRPGLRAVGGA